MKIVFELPHYRPMAGGIASTITLCQEMSKEFDCHVRFQRYYNNRSYDSYKFEFPYSVGPSKDFPQCDVAITYADTKGLQQLKQSGRCKKIAIMMLSYGMAIERERSNALDSDITVMTSTKRTKDLIEQDGGKCFQVGFGLDVSRFYNMFLTREKRVALLSHPSVNKRYEQALKIAKQLIDEGLLIGIESFGASEIDHKVFEGDIRLHPNASPEQICEIFNRCSVFIMPSVTEGLNRTPVEATLCGCPSVLCDGALGDLYFPDVNCKWVAKDEPEELLRAARDILIHDYSKQYMEDMQMRVRPFAWCNVVNNIRKALEI